MRVEGFSCREGEAMPLNRNLAFRFKGCQVLWALAMYHNEIMNGA